MVESGESAKVKVPVPRRMPRSSKLSSILLNCESIVLALVADRLDS